MATVNNWDELHEKLADELRDLSNGELTGAVRLLIGSLRKARRRIKDLEARVERLESETPYRG